MITILNESSSNKTAKRVVEYVRPEVEQAWDLLDDWFEREWGEIPYTESAKSIVVAEFPMTIVRDGSHKYEEGTGVVVLNLIDCRAWYYITDEDGDEFGEFTDSYSNIQEMIDELIQPMADGEITESDFISRCENELY